MKTWIFKPTAFAMAFVAVLLMAACEKTENELESLASVAEQAESPTHSMEITDRSNGNSKIFPPTANPYGKSYAEWTQEWIRGWFASECDNLPFFNPENVLFHTNGPVYIMAGIAEVGGSASVTIPPGKAVLFPLVNTWTVVCEGDLQPGQTEEEYLNGAIADAMPFIDESSLSVTIDGEAVSNLGSYDFVTGVFDITANPDLLECELTSCLTGSPQPSAGGGYYVMLKPLSPGQHTVQYHSEVPIANFVQDATYYITVE